MIQGDLFGRCPTKTEPDTGEASRDPDHWVFYIVFFKLVTAFIIDVIDIHNQIRCDTSCPLQSYTSNELIVSKFERLAQRFPQTAKLVEVCRDLKENNIIVLLLQVGRSTLGQRIVGLRISDNVQQERELLKPMVEVL